MTWAPPPPQAYYYSAIVEDVLLRFSWTLTLSLSTLSGLHGISDILATILAPMEVFRYAPASCVLTSILYPALLSRGLPSEWFSP